MKCKGFWIKVALLLLLITLAWYKVLASSDAPSWRMAHWQRVNPTRVIVTYTNGKQVIFCDEFEQIPNANLTGDGATSCVRIDN